MYAPVCRSMPTRNSRAGLLSRLLLRGASQVKLVSNLGCYGDPQPLQFLLCRGKSCGRLRPGTCDHPADGTEYSQQTPSTQRLLHSALLLSVSRAHAARGTAGAAAIRGLQTHAPVFYALASGACNCWSGARLSLAARLPLSLHRLLLLTRGDQPRTMSPPSHPEKAQPSMTLCPRPPRCPHRRGA